MPFLEREIVRGMCRAHAEWYVTCWPPGCGVARAGCARAYRRRAARAAPESSCCSSSGSFRFSPVSSKRVISCKWSIRASFQASFELLGGSLVSASPCFPSVPFGGPAPFRASKKKEKVMCVSIMLSLFFWLVLPFVAWRVFLLFLESRIHHSSMGFELWCKWRLWLLKR